MRKMPALLSALVAVPIFAYGQSPFPNRPVRIIVPFSIGTGMDLVGRRMGERIGPRLGQPATVENPIGVSGLLGAEMVAKSAPDGHTLLVTASSITIATHLYPTPGFNAMNDLAPVGIVAYTSSTMVAGSKAKFSTLRELITAAKANPGKITFASSGIGSASHLRLEEFQSATGTQFLHVPYKSTGAAMTDVIGGHVDVSLLSTSTITPAVQNGALKAIATATEKRHRLSPNVPTFVEEGITGFLEDGWFGILVPKATPPALVTRLNTEIRAIIESPEVKSSLENAGLTVRTGTPAEMQAILTSDYSKYGAIIRKLNIKPE
jgi:tripartite-type tricarboxylate transporter receptor subunit TctC